MLPKIDPVNYERCYPKRLKRIFQSNLNMKSYDKFIPHIGGGAIVGNIPPELIRLFPQKTRGQDIKNFQNLLADISKYVRGSYYKLKQSDGFTWLNPETYGKSDMLLNWEKELTNVLNGCLRRFTDISVTGDIKYIERGVAGKVFKLSLRDKDGVKIMHDKALKVYHVKSFLCSEVKGCHGNYAEANFWTYLKHVAGHPLDKTQFTKHYISDLDNGYALTEFIDEDITSTTAKMDFQALFKLKYVDWHHNPYLREKIYDVGGFQKMPNFMDDKIVLRYFKKLFFRSEKELPEVLARYEALAQNPKTPHRDKIQRAIDLFKKE